MAKLTIFQEADVPQSAVHPGGVEVDGLDWCKQLSPEGYSLRLVLGELGADGTLTWGEDHGDEGIYLLAGEVEVDGRACPAGGAVVVESGVATTVRALRPTRFVHTATTADGPRTGGVYGPPDPSNHGCHVLGPGGWLQSGDGKDVVATWFADSTCPTCRISLFRVDHRHGFAGPRHNHSQDEIIFVLDGSVQLGKREYFVGTAFCIAAGTNYRVAYPNGGDFLNYRADVSEQRIGKDDAPLLEGALARGGVLVGDFR